MGVSIDAFNGLWDKLDKVDPQTRIKMLGRLHRAGHQSKKVEDFYGRETAREST
jgi:hypothetical protein